ncbi:hypothetical protein GLIP_3454 [Aliiglaciecola lipolytica E3]|uniref:Uncharacterized protein n=1 Tax=Aliiglaciecola lipolytica E3 TaxID=1127673 RepID=K6YHG8_9ALTE|nr:hypothetical protein GLIP_3454 [Aliiglaciecola lipolytica E3]
MYKYLDELLIRRNLFRFSLKTLGDIKMHKYSLTVKSVYF